MIAASNRSNASSLSPSERAVLRVYRRFLIQPGQMLCFYGPELARLGDSLAQLTRKRLLVRERFKGAFSLTEAGFRAMKDCSLSSEPPEKRPSPPPRASNR
jgi:hypothetical protein